MSFIEFVKKNLTSLPYFIGRPISYIPYEFRPGIAPVYRERKAEICALQEYDSLAKQKFVVDRVRNVAIHACENIPFYRDIYKKAGFDPREIRALADISAIPVITKSILQEVPIEYRSYSGKGRSLVNTGGSSGQPLEFFIEQSSVGHEWAHMHHIWSGLGFRQHHLKVVFGGRSDLKKTAQYDSARHQINVNIYSGWSDVASALSKVYERLKPSYLHGYPSSIFDFILWLHENEHPLLGVMRESVKGIFLGSEFPSPRLREQVENLLKCKSVSWYGHTERSVLAYESDGYGTYYPFLTYGYAEECDGRLICTSYYNRASPLIRYDTGDFIEPEKEGGLLLSFKISQGREGEFIVDSQGNKVFLTALIFGRHHELFNHARHVQVYQPSPGRAKILVTPRGELNIDDAEKFFDSSNVKVEFEFVVISKPVRTAAGKVPLLVKELV